MLDLLLWTVWLRTNASNEPACSNKISVQTGVLPCPTPPVKMAAEERLASPFPIKIYTMPELAANPDLLHEVVKLINTAFLKNKHLEGGPRYEYDMQLVEEGGADTLCAIMYSTGEMIASASFQPWRPEQGGPVDEALKVSGRPACTSSRPAYPGLF